MKINVLYLGKISCKRDNLVQCSEESQMIQSPINAILIRHPQALVALRTMQKASIFKCLRLEGSNFRLGGIAPITRAIPSF